MLLNVFGFGGAEYHAYIFIKQMLRLAKVDMVRKLAKNREAMRLNMRSSI